MSQPKRTSNLPQVITATQHADLAVDQAAHHYGTAHIGGRWVINIVVNGEGQNVLTIADDLNPDAVRVVLLAQ